MLLPTESAATNTAQEMERFSRSLVEAAGLPAVISCRPYGRAGKQLWAYDIAGGKNHISLTLVACGFNDFPIDCVEDEVIPIEDHRVADSLRHALAAASLDRR